MTIDDLRAMDSPTITAAVAAKFLRCSPQELRIRARETPGQLGFKVSCPSEHRVKISRESFIKFLAG